MRGRKRLLSPDVVVWTTWNSGETWWPGRVLDRPRSTLPSNKFLVHLFALANCGPFLFAPNRLADYLNDHKHLRANPSTTLQPAVYEADHFIRTEGVPQQRAAIAIAGPSIARPLPLPPPRKSSREKPQWPMPSMSVPSVTNSEKNRDELTPTTLQNVPRANVNRNVSILPREHNAPMLFQYHTLGTASIPQQFNVTSANGVSPVPYAPPLNDLMQQTPKSVNENNSTLQSNKDAKENRTRLPKPPPVIERLIQSAHQLNANQPNPKQNVNISTLVNSGTLVIPSTGNSMTIGKVVQRAATAVTAASKQIIVDAANEGDVKHDANATRINGNANKSVPKQLKPEPNSSESMANSAMLLDTQDHSENIVNQDMVNAATTAAMERLKIVDSTQRQPCILKLFLRPPSNVMKRKRLPLPPVPSKTNPTASMDKKKKNASENGIQRKRTEPFKKRTPDRMMRMGWNSDQKETEIKMNGIGGEKTKAKVPTPRRSLRRSTTPPPAKRKRFDASLAKTTAGGRADASRTEINGEGVDERTQELIGRLRDNAAESVDILKNVMKLPLFVDTGTKKSGDGDEYETLTTQRNGISREVVTLQSKRRSLENKIVRHQKLVETLRLARDGLQDQIAQARKVLHGQDKAKAKLSRELAEAAASQ